MAPGPAADHRLETPPTTADADADRLEALAEEIAARGATDKLQRLHREIACLRALQAGAVTEEYLRDPQHAIVVDAWLDHQAAKFLQRVGELVGPPEEINRKTIERAEARGDTELAKIAREMEAKAKAPSIDFFGAQAAAFRARSRARLQAWRRSRPAVRVQTGRQPERRPRARQSAQRAAGPRSGSDPGDGEPHSHQVGVR